MGVAMKISSLFPNHHFCECDDSFANRFIKNVFHEKKYFFILLLLCEVPSAIAGASLHVYQSSFLFKLILQIPSLNLDPPLLKNSIKFLTFFLVCLCVCACTHTHTIKLCTLLIVYPHIENQWKQCTYTSSTNHCKAKATAWKCDDKVFPTIGKYDDRDFF